MRNKQSSKSTTPPPVNDTPPTQHLRQASQSQNQQYYRDILIKFTPQELDEESKGESQEKPQAKNYQFEVEDIADDSDEERSMKQLNMFQIKSLEAGGGAKQGFVKNFSEHDFLVKDQVRKNNHIMNGATGINKIQLIVRIRPFLISEQIKECLKVVNVSIVQSFLMGLNGTIFAYGQTGAGKTYSIMGGEQRGFELMSSQRRGILPRTLDQVFHNQEYQNCKFSVSFFEIYNEKIFDLLSSNTNQQQHSQQKRSTSRGGSQKPKQNLELREEKDGHFTIPELRKFDIKTLEEAYQYLDKGLLRRSTSSTSSNNKSSRSHSVFQIYLERETDNGVIVRSKIRIVDLAGSEKYTIKKDLPAQEKNQKVQELTSINSSLSALGQCISALSDPSRKHIPYRNSKLTKVLKDSLDENSNVALIICISPSIDSYKETLSTLQFADRAKKAILDGRNFSDSKLLQAQQQNNSESLNNILKAYQEEKAIRKGLEQYMRDNSSQFEVFEELEKLKKQNKELQDKVKLLELNQALGNIDNHSIGKQIKSCMKKPEMSAALQSLDKNELINIKILPFNESNSQSSLNAVVEDPTKKRVRFATKLDNDQSIDSDMRERIEHNLKYNDDTIFDNISIFRDVNNSWIIHRKIVDKEVHPSMLKNKLPSEDDEDDEEEEKKESTDQNQNDQAPNDEEENKVPLHINSLRDEGLKEFWAIPAIQNNNLKIHPGKSQDNNDAFSPICKGRRNNNSSQDLSKDLIDLNNDQALRKLQEQDTSNISEIRVGDKTMGRRSKNKKAAAEKKQQQLQMMQEEIKQEDSFQIYENQQEQEEQEEEEEEDSDGNNPKDYHVCDSSEQFFEGDFNENPIQQVDFGTDQILTDSMIVIEAPNEEDTNNENNGSQDIQTTLILDSQSIIIEGENGNNLRDPNLSQHMQSLEASSILQQKDVQSNQNHNMQHQQQFFFSLGGGQSSSNANSSNLNTDVLTYSLTNTFSTIESLHDELAAIRNGLEVSQKRGANILKNIHKYAREIEDNKMSEYYQSQHPQEELKEEESSHNIRHDEDENINNSSIIDKDLSQFEEENMNFIKDIKGFYSKIHNEIAQLKNILMDSAKNNHSGSPLSSRKHIISERVPQKQNQKQQFQLTQEQERMDTPKGRSSQINIDCIDRSQDIIAELRKEMEIILHSNQKKKSSHNKSLKVLDLLEVLQQSLASAVTPVKSNKSQQLEEQEQMIPSGRNRLQQKSSSDQQQLSNFLQAQNSLNHQQMSQQTQQHNYLQVRSSHPLDGKNIIQYEEIPSIQESPLKSEQQTDNSLSAKKRTPEIFKSLAKLDESDVNNSVPFERDMLFSQSQQTNYQINQNIYFSQQSQNQQDLQITLRSYNVGGNNDNQNQSNYDNYQNANQAEKKRQSAVDNTLTLIFDSDEEQSDQEKVAIEEGESSPIFNDAEDSQIDKAGSFVNRTNNNIVNSNSFQADNSLIFFANNIIIGNDNQENSFQLKQRYRNQSANSKVDKDQVSGMIPERDPTDHKVRATEKGTNKKYLMPKMVKESSDQIQLVQNKPNFKDPQHLSTEDAAVNKSTSKNSVTKYWNQFFNHNNKSMKQNAHDNILLSNQIPQQRDSRNQQQYISRSAYHSNSFKDEM